MILDMIEIENLKWDPWKDFLKNSKHDMIFDFVD